MPFVGDYQGLVATGDLFLSFYAIAHSGDPTHPSAIFANSEVRDGDVNLHTRPVRGAIEPKIRKR